MSRADTDDPVLGHLTWNGGGWETETAPFLPGQAIALRIDCTDEMDPGATLQRARQVFADLRDREFALCQEAAEKYLLDLYNDGWRQEEEGDRRLSLKEFLDFFHFGLLSITSWGSVELWYSVSDGDLDLFGGHGVIILLDEDGRYRQSSLVG